MKELNQFEFLILIALRKVDQTYYQTTYNNVENFRNAFRNRIGRFNGNNFERFGERIFCYEFYYQMRLLIERMRIKNPDYLLGTSLQGEVEKWQILELTRRFRLTALNGEYAPDFLMHSPGNANSHPFVIELKCEDDISPAKVLADIQKINEFVTNYRYERGVFISINTPIAHMTAVLAGIKNSTDALIGRDRIKVICKPRQLMPPRIWQL